MKWLVSSRRRISSTIMSSSGRPVLAMPPPSTISFGSYAWPTTWMVSARPCCTMPYTSMARGSPALVFSIRSGSGGWPGHSLATEPPEVTVSRQPRWPQLHRNLFGSTGMCPISP